MASRCDARRNWDYHSPHPFTVNQKVIAMRRTAPFSLAHRVGMCVALGMVALTLMGCEKRHVSTKPTGWYLEKTGDATANLIHVSSKGERRVWEGALADDSPRSSGLTPLRPGEDKGLFRWSRKGCTELSFVMSRDEMKCTTCMLPTNLVPDSGTCDFDQQRLPVEGWVGVRLPLPR